MNTLLEYTLLYSDTMGFENAEALLLKFSEMYEYLLLLQNSHFHHQGDAFFAVNGLFRCSMEMTIYCGPAK